MPESNEELLRVSQTQKFKQYNEYLSGAQKQQDYLYTQNNLEGLEQVPALDEKVAKLIYGEKQIDQKLANQPQTMPSEERYMQMKSILRDTKKNDFKGRQMTDSKAMEWAMSSAVVEGASAEFTSLINGFHDLMNLEKILAKCEEEYKAIDKKLTDKDLNINLDAESKDALRDSQRERGLRIALYKIQIVSTKMTLTESIKAYHKKNDGIFKSDKGRARLNFADYLDRRINGNAQQQNKSIPCKAYTKESEQLRIFAKKYKMASTEGMIKNYLRGGVLAAFSKKYPMNIERVQITSLIDANLTDPAEIEKDQERIFKAMDFSLKGDNTALYEIMDKRVAQIMEYSVPDKLFDKKWMVKHPKEVIKFRQFGWMCGDIMDHSTQVMNDITSPYLHKLEKENPEGYKRFMNKTTVLANLFQQFSMSNDVMFGFDFSQVDNAVLTSAALQSNAEVATQDRYESMLENTLSFNSLKEYCETNAGDVTKAKKLEADLKASVPFYSNVAHQVNRESYINRNISEARNAIKGFLSIELNNLEYESDEFIKKNQGIFNAIKYHTNMANDLLLKYPELEAEFNKKDFKIKDQIEKGFAIANYFDSKLILFSDPRYPDNMPTELRKDSSKEDRDVINRKIIAEVCLENIDNKYKPPIAAGNVNEANEEFQSYRNSMNKIMNQMAIKGDMSADNNTELSSYLEQIGSNEEMSETLIKKHYEIPGTGYKMPESFCRSLTGSMSNFKPFQHVGVEKVKSILEKLAMRPEENVRTEKESGMENIKGLMELKGLLLDNARYLDSKYGKAMFATDRANITDQQYKEILKDNEYMQQMTNLFVMFESMPGVITESDRALINSTFAFKSWVTFLNADLLSVTSGDVNSFEERQKNLLGCYGVQKFFGKTVIDKIMNQEGTINWDAKFVLSENQAIPDDAAIEAIWHRGREMIKK